MASERTYTIEGVDCAVCAARIEKAINSIEGVESSQIDLLHNKLRIRTDRMYDESIDESIFDTVAKEEPGTRVLSFSSAETGTSESTPNKVFMVPLRLVATIALVLVSQAPFASRWFVALNFIAYMIVGFEIVAKALRNLLKGNVFDENFLMTLATVGAFAIGEYTEAIAVMAFYQVGEYFQDLAVDRSRRSIAKLMDIKPVVATVVRNGAQVTLDPAQIQVGELLLIKPGEKVPVDAQVVEGESRLDTSALTGESLPRDVKPGDDLISGSINGSGVIHAKATKRYEDSTVANILKLVEESSQRKAQTERFITRFAKYYTPIVVGLAVSLALLPPLFTGEAFSTWVYRALIFLVISCPCALVISVPLGFFGGIGGLARMGILVKGGNHIQTLARTSVVVFDKTGTITKGTFSVVDMQIADGTEYSTDHLVAVAKALESHSNHPIARAIAAYGTEYRQSPNIHHIQEVPGKGMEGLIDESKVLVGTADLMRLHNLSIPPQLSTPVAGPSVLIAMGDMVVGRMVLEDIPKQESGNTMEELRSLGVKRIVMLSGDETSVVASVATQVGMDEYHGKLLPQDKIQHVERMMEQKSGKESLLFVGDGINDAPVLARADIGASMGAIGSDAAVEASDMVIMGDGLSHIPRGIRHARKTMSIVTQNIVFALGVKALVMLLGIFGIASMWLAVFADTGVALLAVMNSLRALRFER
jgi:Cd2+/Zn2+-exporting ATPase